MQTIGMKKINVSIPSDLLKEVDKRAEVRNTTRSRIIREFLQVYLDDLKKLELKESLKEGYILNSERDQGIANEFIYADFEQEARLKKAEEK